MPYIPKEHEKYGLLPKCRKCGGEVFDYPSNLILKIEEIMGFSSSVFPYNFNSYEEYFSSVDGEIESRKDNVELVRLLNELKDKVREMNTKEEWSVLKYVGESTDSLLGLTCGKVYYWPTCKANPVYNGVVDDEEFTSYMYPTDSSIWEILEDPTGMAYNTIYNNGKGALSIKDYDHIMAQLADTTAKGGDIDYDFSGAEE